MTTTLTIEARYCGPPNSGNGGYVAGRVAALVGDAAEVTLRQPPPLDLPLSVVRSGDDNVQIFNGDALVVEAKAADPVVVPPEPVDFATAAAAVDADAIEEQNVFAGCFVCGPGRDHGDGLRIFSGLVGDAGLMAAPWIPHGNFADDGDRVATEYLWSALDCPSGFAASGGKFGPLLLGRITGRVAGYVGVGEAIVIMSWPIGREGRKYFAGSALFGANGDCAAIAETVWLAPRPSI